MSSFVMIGIHCHEQMVPQKTCNWIPVCCSQGHQPICRSPMCTLHISSTSYWKNINIYQLGELQDPKIKLNIKLSCQSGKQAASAGYSLYPSVFELLADVLCFAWCYLHCEVFLFCTHTTTKQQ